MKRLVVLIIGFLLIASPALAQHHGRSHRPPRREKHLRRNHRRPRRLAKHHARHHRKSHRKSRRLAKHHARHHSKPRRLAKHHRRHHGRSHRPTGPTHATGSTGAPKGPAGSTASAGSAGSPSYRLDAGSYFDSFAGDTSWIAQHIATIKGYPPFSNRYVATGVPVIGYHDPATEGYAPLTPAKIASLLAKVLLDRANGYAGVFIDDVNWGGGYRDGTQSKTLEPEAHEQADLLEAIRAAWPTAEIEMNSQWHDLKANLANANVQRGLAAVSVLTKEFGVGPTAGVGAGDYRELLEFDEGLHARGKHMVFTGDYHNNNVPTMEWNLATMLLVNDGADAVNGTSQTPTNWWPGFNVNLGGALGPGERQAGGLWVRHFSDGVVYALEPGSSTQTVTLGAAMHSAEWGTVSSVTLNAGQGAVLARSG